MFGGVIGDPSSRRSGLAASFLAGMGRGFEDAPGGGNLGSNM